MSGSVSFRRVRQDGLYVIHGQVFDLSSFKHPGGLAILKPWKGRDATAAFEEHHGTDMLGLAKKFLVGPIDQNDEEWKKDVLASAKEVEGDRAPPIDRSGVPDISTMLNTFDFTKVAEKG